MFQIKIAENSQAHLLTRQPKKKITLGSIQYLSKLDEAIKNRSLKVVISHYSSLN